MDFSDALKLLRQGKLMARHSWQQPGKYVFLAPERKVECPDGVERTIEPHLLFVDHSRAVRVGDQPSHSGLFGDDWYVVSSLS